jgi:hypothetical protein
MGMVLQDEICCPLISLSPIQKYVVQARNVALGMVSYFVFSAGNALSRTVDGIRERSRKTDVARSAFKGEHEKWRERDVVVMMILGGW